MRERKNICELTKERLLFFDGGTGSVLQGMGLQPGELPETWNLLHPEKIQKLHYNYYLAGANIIKTNTFGANELKFSQQELETIIAAAVKNAKEARRKIEEEPYAEGVRPNGVDVAGEPHYIALDIGPTGKLLEPLGDLKFEDAISIFSNIVKIGAKQGVDLILIETMNDSYEAKAAVLAAKENSDLPVFVTTVYDETAKLLTGADPASMVATLEGLRVDALGMNCSLGPRQMASIVPQLVTYASVPVIVNPNAGLPRTENGQTLYDVDAPEFAELVSEFVTKGAGIVGGCCGTTPEHICRLVEACQKVTFTPPIEKNHSMISSHTHAVFFGERPILVGERINPTGKKKLKQALRDKDMDYIIEEGIKQEENGADVLDVNVGLPEIDEPQMMLAVVEELQSITGLPLQIDTSDLQAMEAALRAYNGKALVNSVNGKQEVMHGVFPLVKKYGGLVVALTIDESGIPTTAEGRIAIVEKIYKTAAEYGIQKKDIIVDPLAMSVSSDDHAALATLETLRTVHDKFHGNTILGVSNISFGLPKRELITSTFFTMAMQNGLSAAIMNPSSVEMRKAHTCFCTLKGYDPQCMNYIDFATNYEVEATTTEQVKTAGETGEAGEKGSLTYAVVHGLKDPAAEATRELLKTEESLKIINEKLIPALDIVGKGFEEKRVYLPQLLMSAEAAKSAFAVIKEEMEKAGKADEKKGKIILATVKGDIHDIGKNIVKVLLENYSYEVLDLGKDVPPEKIVETCIEQQVKLVGLSALMTTTVPSMEETISQLREKAPWCKVVVGGAVLNQEYADMIGADFYAKDAMETVAVAQQIFG
ncbi:MAG: homocysteine S-methyltransferase family protein [Lachnospiraceae bacterium]